MKDEKTTPLPWRWAHLRFSIVGPLLASPPAPGELMQAFQGLSEREWLHPETQRPMRFSAPTIERWYYAARNAPRDPVGALLRAVRCDRGQTRRLTAELRDLLTAQYREHPSWSFQLHYDNLLASAKTRELPGRMPSYSTVRRFMKQSGMVRQRRVRHDLTTPFTPREVRSYEQEHVNALWHADFHLGSLRVLTPNGESQRPHAFGALDDYSRRTCHVQWYLSETAEAFVHGLSQALQRLGLPRSLMTDNGSAMTAAETVEGLERLGIVHVTTLPYSPWQNGKQEHFWSRLEGRLLPMLENRRDLTLNELNVVTQVWCEDDYNRKVHRELDTTPEKRFHQGTDLGRESPDSDALRLAFTTQVKRRQRRSDGTISLAGRRYEVPGQYHHLADIWVRYARWDLSRLHLVDPVSGDVIDRLYPQDKSANADARRRSRPFVSDTGTSTETAPDTTAPLLSSQLERHEQSGEPAAYIPLDETSADTEEEE